MDILFATVACSLLAISFPVAQTVKGNSTITPTTAAHALNMTQATTFVTSSNSTVHASVISNVTEDTVLFTSTTWDNETYSETTVHPTTSQSTTMSTPLTNTTSPTTTTPSAHIPTLTVQTTAGYITTPDTTVVTTANSSHSVNTTSESVDRITQGFGLNVSEKNMTIVFSVTLGVFAAGLLMFTFHKCKHKIQYLHQPLNNTSETADGFRADDDTLIISGGLYDGHPIYDNIPTVPAEQSQFRLEFLH